MCSARAWALFSSARLPPFYGLFAQGSYDLGVFRPTNKPAKPDVQGFSKRSGKVDAGRQKNSAKFDLAF
jgi:hypothetical protein